MRLAVRFACFPRWESRLPKQTPPEGGRNKEEARADRDTEALAAKCTWQGEYIRKKAHDAPINEIQAGWATTDQVITLLKNAQFLPQDAVNDEVSLTNVNWKAVTGYIFEKDLDEWRIHPVRGDEICTTLGIGGLQLQTAARLGPNLIGEIIMDCAWTEARVRLGIDPGNTEPKALPNETYWEMRTQWPPQSASHEGLPNWNPGIVANIIETYATCTFLRGNKRTRMGP